MNHCHRVYGKIKLRNHSAAGEAGTWTVELGYSQRRRRRREKKRFDPDQLSFKGTTFRAQLGPFLTHAHDLLDLGAFNLKSWQLLDVLLL